MDDTNNELEDNEQRVVEPLRVYIGAQMVIDVACREITDIFIQIADTDEKYCAQRKRISNIIQHSLIDYQDKPYRYYMK